MSVSTNKLSRFLRNTPSKRPVPACTAFLLKRSKCLLGPRNKLLSLNRKAYFLATSIRLEIWCFQTSLWVIPLSDFLLDMDESILLTDFVEAPFTMMLPPVLFGLKIRYHQEPVKHSQGRIVFNDGFGSKHVLRYLTCIVTMIFFLINSVWAVITNIKIYISLVLEYIIRTQYKN